MKRKLDFRIVIIIILVIVLCIMLKIYFNDKNESDLYFQKEFSGRQNSINQKASSNSNMVLQTTSEIISGLSENLELHATYYFSECYVQTNQEIKEGDKILKYTNGTYLVAPYDCVITELNIPDENGKCNNEHYVGISSVNTLALQFKVDESKVNELSIGQSAKIKISAFEEKEIEGYITKISSTASNGKFTVTVEFNNDKDIKIGMTASVSVNDVNKI